MAEDKDKKKGDKSANQYLVEASEGKFLGAQTGLLSGDTLRTAVDLHTGILAGTLKVNSFGLVDMESTGETRRRLKGKKRDSGGLKDGGIGALKEEQARRLGLLSAADFATNDQCILLEMAKKIYDYAVTPGTPEILSAPPITSAHQGMAALDPTLQEMMTGGAAIKSPKIGLAIPATAAIKSITQLGTIYKNNYDVIRGITLHRKSTRFLEITPAQVAQLSPLIYLSVDYYDKSGNRARRIPLDFPNKAMLKENILQSSGQRFGGGIKDITITHEGIDSATEKIVLIDSTFIFQDFRTASQGNYEELLKIGTRGSDSNLRRYINFEFGWDSNGKTRARHGGLALETMRSHVRGELVKYTFDFAEDGSIVLKTQHRGHLHTIFGDSPAANLLSAQKAAEEGLRAQSVQIINANKSKLLRDNKNSLRENRLQQLAAKVAHRALEKSHITGLARRVSTSTLSLDTSATTEEMLAQFAGAAPSTDIEAGLKTPTALLTQDEINMVNSRAKSLLKSAYYAHTQNQGTGGGAVEGETLQVTHTQMDATMRELRKATHNVKVQNDALQQNLKAKNIHNFAAAQFQKKVGLLRFTTLFNLATSLSEKQKVYYGGIDSEKRIQIASALAYQPTLQQAFGGLTAQSFLTHPRQIGGDSTFQNMLQNKGAAGSEMAIATALTKMTTFPFVFLGDFLQTILDTPATLGTKSGTMFELMKETAGVDIEILLGYLSYETPFAGTKVDNLPLYYLPISLRKLNYFIAREIVGKDRVFYSFGALIKDLIKKLIDTAFYNCIREAGTGSSPVTPKLDYSTGERGGRDVFFIYDSKQFINNMKGKKFGNYRNNLRLKIPHFYLGGADKGIAQKIQLRDIADPSLKTAVYYKQTPSKASSDEGTAGPEHGRWAPTVFEAQVDTLGYPNFQLGQLVFIDARQFVGASAQKNFMATGYYGIHKIVHKLTPDTFTTTINGIIQMSEKDKDQINSEAQPADPSTTTAQPYDESDPANLGFAPPPAGPKVLTATIGKWTEEDLKRQSADVEDSLKRLDTLTSAATRFSSDYLETSRYLQAKIAAEQTQREDKAFVYDSTIGLMTGQTQWKLGGSVLDYAKKKEEDYDAADVGIDSALTVTTFGAWNVLKAVVGD